MRVIQVFFICLLAVTSGCATRGLTVSEVSSLKVEYSDKLSYENVRIVKKNINEIEDYKLEKEKILELNPSAENAIIETRPFVINNKIFYPKKYYSRDFSEYIGDSDPEWSRFVHENCHILQFQKKLTSDIHNGKEYTWRLGLKEQLTIKNPYKIPPPEDITPSDNLEDFGFEQQCQFFYVWALYKHNDHFSSYGELIRRALNRDQNPNRKSIAQTEGVIKYEGDFNSLVDIVEAAVIASKGSRGTCNDYIPKIKNKKINRKKSRASFSAKADYCNGLIQQGFVKSKITVERISPLNYKILVSIKAPEKGYVWPEKWWQWLFTPYENRPYWEKLVHDTISSCLNGTCKP